MWLFHWRVKLGLLSWLIICPSVVKPCNNTCNCILHDLFQTNIFSLIRMQRARVSKVLECCHRKQCMYDICSVIQWHSALYTQFSWDCSLDFRLPIHDALWNAVLEPDCTTIEWHSTIYKMYSTHYIYSTWYAGIALLHAMEDSDNGQAALLLE